MQTFSFSGLTHNLRSVFVSLLCLLAVNVAVANTGSANVDAAVKSTVQDSLVNINAADAATLADALVGIGIKRAEAIVDYRDAHGKFQDPYELVAVKGVGEAIVAKNEARIRLHD